MTNKKILPFTGLLFVVISFCACIKDFSIVAPGSEKTVVYGLLDKNETRHYIRIQKAFLDRNKSAYVMAQVNDSIYYTDMLKVILKDLKANRTYTLKKAYGDTVGIYKDSGQFSNSPNVLYYFDATLNADAQYQLVVTNVKTGNEVSAAIYLANSPVLLFPRDNISIEMTDSNKLSFIWNSGKNDRVFDLKVRFNYQEWDITNPSVVQHKSIDWIGFAGVNSTSTDGGEKLTYQFDGRSLYGTLQQNLSVNSNLRRRADPVDALEFYLYAGGEEFYNYTLVKSAQSGISTGSDLPIYTNINNGLGIFSSRTYSLAKNVSLNHLSSDSLLYGTRTKALNFQP
jgi:Icc-related predicted phosphoesterase